MMFSQLSKLDIYCLIKTRFNRVLKANIFPNCSILEAKEGSSVSYIWRSILKGRDVLKKGIRWRVGTGEDILLTDPWLPYRDKLQLQLPLSEALSTARVVDLIDLTTKQWDVTQMDNLFLLREVNSIFSIPLYKNQVQYTII